MTTLQDVDLGLTSSQPDYDYGGGAEIGICMENIPYDLAGNFRHNHYFVKGWQTSNPFQRWTNWLAAHSLAAKCKPVADELNPEVQKIAILRS
jgi:hypothetical protein